MLRRLIISTFLLANIFTVGSVLLAPQLASAASSQFCRREGTSLLGFPTWYKYLNPRYTTPAGGNQEECVIDFDPRADVPKVILAIFEIVLRIGGIVSVVFVIYGGFIYMMSTGEPDKARNARTTIINALVGLVITTLAVAIVNLIGRNIA